MTCATATSNEILTLNVLQELAASGVDEFIICPSSRNSPFVQALLKMPQFKIFYHFEERSAAFFAIGRIRQKGTPVGVITTSGSAAGELLPATMEAYYRGIPLILMTADRPRRFRHKGAPQSAEQVNLFGVYAPFSQDLANEELCDMQNWTAKSPFHLNICFEEPLNHPFSNVPSLHIQALKATQPPFNPTLLDQFFQKTENPIVVVGDLPANAREKVAQFLLKLNAPVYLEAISGLRNKKELQHLRLHSEKISYPLDGLLRIGGIPTFRYWRDLEDKEDQVEVLSISEVPFPGLSWGNMICTSLESFFDQYQVLRSYDPHPNSSQILEAISRYPYAETSLIHELSKKIPRDSLVFLGNSLPIREWDQAACSKDRNHNIQGSRGLNGIDGQISTFLGLCKPNQANWAIFGDLTTLYDMAGPWVLSQMPNINVQIVVINNYGGQIFARMYRETEFLNQHKLSFKPLAELWGINYESWVSIPDNLESNQSRLIEIIPDMEATKSFWGMNK